jgi:hypothetical protein
MVFMHLSETVWHARDLLDLFNSTLKGVRYRWQHSSYIASLACSYIILSLVLMPLVTKRKLLVIKHEYS